MADVTVNGAVYAGTARGMRTVVFVSADVGYCFFVDSAFDLKYSKTTDGGATWGAAVNLFTGTVIALDVWFDQWTPGDTGTLIHFWYFDTGSDDVKWRTLDTADDSLGTERVCFAGATAVEGRGVFVSGTKTRSGYLYCAFDIDAGAERGLHRSTDGGTTWSADLDDTFVEATLDECLLFPASNTGDDNDCWALYYDHSATALTLKMWDSSAGSASESATILTLTEHVADNTTGQHGFSGAIRHSDGHLIVAAISERDTATADHRTFDINGTGSITELTAITTDIDDHYYPAVCIDQTTDDIHVAFNGLRDGSETLGTTCKIYYTKSTDGGSSWSAGSTAYSESAAGANLQVWAPLSGPRFYVVWRNTSLGDIIGNKVNSLTFSAGQTVAVNQATETDLAQAIAWAPKNRLAAQVTETDLAQALTRRKTKAIAQAAESELAQPITAVKSRTVVQITETDLAQAVARAKTRTMAQAVEADLAQAITRVKTRILGQSLETDVAQPVTPASGVILVPVGQVLETDLAQPVLWAPKRRLVAQASELELAQPVNRVKQRLLAQALETDLAQLILAVFPAALGRPPYSVSVADPLDCGPAESVSTTLGSNPLRCGPAKPSGVTLGGSLNVELT